MARTADKQAGAGERTRSPSAGAEDAGKRPPRPTLRSVLRSLMVAALLLALNDAVISTAAVSSISSGSESGSSAPLIALEEGFSETLLLTPLPDGKVSAVFEFTLESPSTSTTHFRLLPRPLLQPIQRFGVDEVHLSLNSGRWNYERWGLPTKRIRNRSNYVPHSEKDQGPGQGQTHIRLGEESVGSGAELWARFASSSASVSNVEENNVHEKWKGLTSSLAGLFCTSLERLDEVSTTSPAWAYSLGTSATGVSREEDGRLMHAFLPTENVCTENLTPLLKLLPCKGSAGLSSLLNPLSLFSATFQGLSVHVTRSPARAHLAAARGWTVKFTVSTVFSPAQTRDVSVRDWSLHSLFGRKIQNACPVAAQSLIRILAPPQQLASGNFTSQEYVIFPLPKLPEEFLPSYKNAEDPKSRTPLPILEENDEIEDELSHAGLLSFQSDEVKQTYDDILQKRWAKYLHDDGEYVYDLKDLVAASSPDQNASSIESSTPMPATATDISMKWPNETRYKYPYTYPSDHFISTSSRPPIAVARTLLGHGQERTTLQLVLTNSDRVAQRIIWFEALGFFVSPWLHTMSHSVEFLSPLATVEGTVGREEIIRTTRDFDNPIEKVSYQPPMRTSNRESLTTQSNVVGKKRPVVLESLVRIPARSRITLQIELKKTFVPYSQHPPDAHRGFDLAPAIVFCLGGVDPRSSIQMQRGHIASDQGKPLMESTFMTSLCDLKTGSPWVDAQVQRLAEVLSRYLSSASRASTDENAASLPSWVLPRNNKVSRIYLQPQLVELATPDFSFVYTNIIFTSTIIALFFGSCLNGLLRQYRDFVLPAKQAS